jgi:hypothetical protein
VHNQSGIEGTIGNLGDATGFYNGKSQLRVAVSLSGTYGVSAIAGPNSDPGRAEMEDLSASLTMRNSMRK